MCSCFRSSRRPIPRVRGVLDPRKALARRPRGGACRGLPARALPGSRRRAARTSRRAPRVTAQGARSRSHGGREEHIVADIAWAAACYIDWTGDGAFRKGAGRKLSSRRPATGPRGELDRTARGAGTHPWRYRPRRVPRARRRQRVHERDGALEPAARAESDDPDRRARERDRGRPRRRARGRLSPQSGLYEQFAGFFALEPLIVSEIAPRRPIAADLLLSPEP